MMKINKDNLNSPPKYRKQLKTISVEVPICPRCNQDLYVTNPSPDADPEYNVYACTRTPGCGYNWMKGKP